MSTVNQSKKSPHKKVQQFLVSAEAHSFETTTLEAVRPWRRKDDGHRAGQVLRDIALGRLVRGSSQQLDGNKLMDSGGQPSPKRGVGFFS